MGGGVQQEHPLGNQEDTGPEVLVPWLGCVLTKIPLLPRGQFLDVSPIDDLHYFIMLFYNSPTRLLWSLNITEKK